MLRRKRHRLFLRWALAGAAATLLIYMWSRQITTAPIANDGSQSLQMGINLARHGTLALESQPPLSATNYREPLLPITTAVVVRIIDTLHGDPSPDHYFSGRLAQRIKYQNVIWLAFFSIAAFWVAYKLTSSFYVALLAVIAVNLPFRPHVPPSSIDDLLSEIPSLGFLIAGSGMLASALDRQRTSSFVWAGLMFGMLTLVKAIALYAFILAMVALAWYLFQASTRLSVPQAARKLALSIVAFACVIGPWMYRNHVQLGTLQITQRAGESLQERSLEDGMSAQEKLGAIYLWAPVFQRQLGHALGFSADDLRRGGRLQRLNDQTDSPLSEADLAFERAGLPDRTVTFYRRARAEREQLESQLAASGAPHPEVEADRLLRNHALASFADHPWRHIATSPLFLWRGGIKTFLILAIAIVIAAKQARKDLVLFMLPSLGITLAYAVFTPFFPRYDLPTHIVSILALIVVAKSLWDGITTSPGIPALSGSPAP